MNVACCPNAFSANSPCKLALCPTCNAERTAKKPLDDGKKKRRGDRGNESVVKLTLTEQGGDCPDHVMGDELALGMETNKGYLKGRNKKADGSENIVEYCIFCGIRF